MAKSYVVIPGDSPVIEVQDVHIIDNATLDYLISYIYVVNDIVNLTKLDKISILPYGDYRGMFCQTKDGQHWVELCANTKSFRPDYRGYQYKVFGGMKDLTPGGVLAHEFSHYISFLDTSLFKTFKKIRKHSNCFTRYGQSRLGEDIAETGRLYISNPVELCHIDEQRYDAFHAVGKSYLR